MVEDESQTSPIRLAVVGVICLALFSSLFVRLYYLQIIDHQTYQEVSQAVHTRTKHEQAPRGRILDRNGKVLVTNETVVVVGIDKEVARSEGLGNGEGSDSTEQVDKRTEVFTRFARVMNRLGQPVKVVELETLYTDRRYGPNDFIPVASDDIKPELQALLIERSSEYPGIAVKSRSVRSYPYGTRAAHLLGYVGRINDTEMKSERVIRQGTPDAPASPDAKPYALSDEIGKAGVERTMEEYLRGKPGITTIQVDARGQRIGTLKEPEFEPGEDVWLTIDIDVQAALEDELRSTVLSRRGQITGCNPACNAQEGAAVVLDPGSGEIIASASYPTYDPAELVNGISTETWERLNSKENHEPMLNRVTSQLYAPGSTYKLISTIAGLRTGVITADFVWQDRGKYTIENCKFNCVRQNAGAARLGALTMQRAISQSSDTYYYRMADVMWQRRGELGEQPIQDVAFEFGLGAKTGVQLPSESAGRIGTPEWLRNTYDANPEAFDHRDWTVGDNVNASIGQGMTDVTALQLANAYAAFANRGTVFQTQIVKQVTKAKTLAGAANDITNVEVVKHFSPATLGSIEWPSLNDYTVMFNGFRDAVMSGSGTANDSYKTWTPAWPVAGKTGTAQVSKKADTSLFVGWGPAALETPAEYVMASIIPEGGFGDAASGALTMRMLKMLSERSWPEAFFTPPAQAAAGPQTEVDATATTTTTTIPIADSEPPIPGAP